jgi:membrane-bound metal-dependent hydrolase YbcI (DUF457 family)
MLFAAAISEACLPRDAPHRNWKIAAGAVLGLVPDVDFAPVWWLGWPRDWHRGFTHSFAFAVIAGALLLVTRGRREMRECVALTLALMSHGMLDFLTSLYSPGVALLWPFSTERYSLGWTSAFEFRVDSATLREFAGSALRISVFELAIFLPPLALVSYARRRAIPATTNC